MKTIFVAGTDTGVGKTMVAGAMAAALRLKGRRVAVMKPVSCGGREDAEFLTRCAGINEPIDLVNPIVFEHPVSPNVAAKLEGKKFNLSAIVASQKTFSRKYDVLVIEGCGGLLVPIDGKILVIDLIRALGAQTVLVSRSGLGAINHSLLSLESLRARKIKPLGVLFNRLAAGPLSVPERTNPGVVARYGRTRSLGVFPYLKRCSADCAGRAFLKHIDFKKFL